MDLMTHACGKTLTHQAKAHGLHGLIIRDANARNRLRDRRHCRVTARRRPSLSRVGTRDREIEREKEGRKTQWNQQTGKWGRAESKWVSSHWECNFLNFRNAFPKTSLSVKRVTQAIAVNVLCFNPRARVLGISHRQREKIMQPFSLTLNLEEPKVGIELWTLHFTAQRLSHSAMEEYE